MSKALSIVANRMNVDEEECYDIVKKMCMEKDATKEEFTTFIAVANEYELNPLVSEIFAFKAQGKMKVIVSVDGWIKIINRHPDFNGMEYKDEKDENNNIVSITCIIHKKSITHPVSVTEYLSECKGTTKPWEKWPARMLRHKATSQCARYAFGISNIVDPDEGERMKDGGLLQPESVTINTNRADSDSPAQPHDDDGVVSDQKLLPECPDEKFLKVIAFCTDALTAEKKTVEQLIESLSCQFTLSDQQIEAIRSLEK